MQRLLSQRAAESEATSQAAAAETAFWKELGDLLPILAHHHAARAKDSSIGASARQYHGGLSARIRTVLGWSK